MSSTRNPNAICEDDVDIYEDLPDFQLGDTIQKLQDDNKNLNVRIVQLTAELQTLRCENEKLRKTNHNLSCNISCLYKTATAEIERKDAAIAELRRNLDDYVFRRKKKTGVPERNTSGPSSISIPLIVAPVLKASSASTSKEENNPSCKTSKIKHDTDKDSAHISDKWRKAFDKRECDGETKSRSRKETEVLQKEPEQKVVDKVGIVSSNDEMVENGKQTSSSTDKGSTYPSDKWRKAFDKKERDGETKSRSRKETEVLQKEPEQKVVDKVGIVSSNDEMVENGKQTSSSTDKGSTHPSDKWRKTFDKKECDGETKSKSRKEAEEVIVPLQKESEQKVVESVAIVSPNDKILENGRQANPSTDKGSSRTSEKCKKTSDKKECDGERNPKSRKVAKERTILLKNEPELKVVGTSGTVSSKNEMLENGQHTKTRSAHTSEKCKKTSDKKECDGERNPKSRKVAKEGTALLKNEPEQKVVDTSETVSSTNKMVENDQLTNPSADKGSALTSEKCKKSSDRKGCEGGTKSKSRKKLSEVTNITKEEPEPGMVDAVRIVNSNNEMVGNDRGTNSGTDKDTVHTSKKCEKASDKRGCDGRTKLRSRKKSEKETVQLTKVPEQQASSTAEVVCSNEEMLENGKRTNPSTDKDSMHTLEKFMKSSDGKECDTGTKSRSRRKPEEVTGHIRKEQQVVDTSSVVCSNEEMKEDGKQTHPDRLKPYEEINKNQNHPTKSEKKDQKNLQLNCEPDKLPSDRKRKYSSEDGGVRTQTEFNYACLKEENVLNFDEAWNQVKEAAAKKPKLSKLSLKSQSGSRKPSDHESPNQNIGNVQGPTEGNERNETMTFATVAPLLSPPLPSLQPPLPKEKPKPLPPPPVGTPPPTPDKSAFSVVRIKEGTNEKSQETVSTSCLTTVLVNKSEADSTTGSIPKPVIASPVNQTSYLQCPFKSRCRVRSVELVLNSDTEDSSFISKRTDVSKSCQKKAETTLAQRNTNRVTVDFNHKKSSSKADERVMSSNRHPPSSCKPTVQGSSWCERRSPSELLRGRRRSRVDRVSHLENGRVRSIRDRRSRSHSPQRSSSWRDRRHGNHQEHDAYQRRNRKQVTSSSSRNGTHSRQKDDGSRQKDDGSRQKDDGSRQKDGGCHQQVSQPSVKSRDELKSEAKLKFRTELFGESSPEPERRVSPTFSCSISVSSTNSSIAVSAAAHAQNQLISSSKENSNPELPTSLPPKNQNIPCETKQEVKTSPAVPTEPDLEDADVIVKVIRSRSRSNFKLENSTDPPVETSHKEVSHISKEVKQVAKQECGAKSLTRSRLVATPRNFRQRYAEVFSSAGDESESEFDESDDSYSPGGDSDVSFRPYCTLRKPTRRKICKKKGW